MNINIRLIIFAIPLVVAACDAIGPDKSRDRGIDAKPLTELKAGIWVDSEGCDHWIIDDGLEGYMSARLDKYGKPVCSGVAPPNVATGPFKAGTQIFDPTRPSEHVTFNR